ncbi:MULTISPECIES: PIG-L deacetylase family protein [unclassified Acinetobacter]|uniref:PIG-L deacetylase family protein n=1 Tax=unclassified Acinetobacter TaxID=196816 RepID=UPI0015D15B02|nr:MULTISPECIES: PIG-L family deacetylase [unclassified Acinetobacter]
MGTLKHEIVEDRVIHGEGTRVEEWRNCEILQQIPEFNISNVIPADARVCIVAPHPDDEILGCGGLMQRLDKLGYKIVLFAVTNGTASHPGSSLYTPEELNQIRPAETRQALEELSLEQPVLRIALDIQDGKVAEQRDLLKQQLYSYLQPNDVLVTTFVHDGHPDHEITGQVVQQLATELQLPYIQVLIWAWHWATPGDTRIPWTVAHKLRLTDEELKCKARAARCFKSQIENDPTTEQAPIVPEHALERVLQPWEVYLYEQ